MDRDGGTWVDANGDGTCDPETEIEWHHVGTLSGTAKGWLCYATDPRTRAGAIRQVLPVGAVLDFGDGVTMELVLRDAEGVVLAIMSVTDRWTPDKGREAQGVFATQDTRHPAVNYLRHRSGPVYLGGPVTGIQQPVHYDFRGRRNTPNELRTYFRKLGWRRIVAFQTRNPLHRAHHGSHVL